MKQYREITAGGTLALILSSTTGIIGMNLNFPFLWLPSFALIFYFLPFISYFYRKWEVSAHRIVSATTVTLGGFFYLKIELQNMKQKAITFTLDSKYSDSFLLVKGWSLNKISLDPGETKSVSFIFAVSNRGVHEIHTLYLYKSDPLGLYRDVIEFSESIPIQVIPARPQIRLDKMQKQEIRHSLVGQYAFRRKGQGDEFFALDDYRRGDEPRKIYWKKSARLGRLISKEYEDEVVFRLFVAIDTSYTMRSRKLEYSLTSLLELAEMCSFTHDTFGFIAFADQPIRFLKPTTSPRLYEKVSKLVFNLSPQVTRARFETILPYIFSLKGTRSLLIILSDSEGVLEEKLKAIIRLSKFGHHLIFCEIRADKFGISDSKINPYDLNTYEKITNLNIIHDKVEKNYRVREVRIREVLEKVGGSYIRIESYSDNLMVLIKKELTQIQPLIAPVML
ncbi:MAG: DUF58 domain-containing protein [Candidatus Hodarchaeales archaeon]